MLILIAHSGKTIELDCDGDTRVDVVLQALSTLTGLALNDQLLIFGGQKLEPSNTLSSHGLPQAAGVAAPGGLEESGDGGGGGGGGGDPGESGGRNNQHKARHVFLYCKSLLRPDASPPPPEQLEHIMVEEPPPMPPSGGGGAHAHAHAQAQAHGTSPQAHDHVYTQHPLDHAPSPLIRALPDYERQFRHQRLRAAAVWRATQARFEACRRLVMEMHVQALAIDSARDNVDLHFSYICRYQGEFSRSHAAQTAGHAELLAAFDADMEALRATPLHPAVVAASERRHAAAAAAAREAQQRAKQFAAAAAAGSSSSSPSSSILSGSVVGAGGGGGGGERIASGGESGGGSAPVSGASTPAGGVTPRSGGGVSRGGTPSSSAPPSPSRAAAGVTATSSSTSAAAVAVAVAVGIAATPSSSAPTVPAVPPVRRTLLDCVPEDRVRRWAADCRRSHEHFTAKVRDLGGLFAALQRTTEELFMTGPDVDIAALEGELERVQGKLAEQAAVIQCLDKDLETVGRLVEDTVADMAAAEAAGGGGGGGGGSGGGGGGGMSSTMGMGAGALDACAALDPMNELHVKSHIPAIESADGEVAALHRHCGDCKDAMAACVHRQLQSISALQSKIRDMRNKQAAFKEVGQRQEAAFRELRIARRIPRVYCACLAEVARRAAHAQLFSGQARQLAERMARSREREVARREAFARSHERYLPSDVVASLGLHAPPPQCEVTVKSGSGSGEGGADVPLAVVTEDDLRRLGMDARTAYGGGGGGGGGASASGSGAAIPTRGGGGGVGAWTGTSPPTMPQSPVAAATAAAAAALLGVLDGPDDGDDGDSQKGGGGGGGGGISLGDIGGGGGGAGGGSAGGSGGDLHMENARLRADLAAHVALLATLDPQRVVSAAGGAGGGGGGVGATAKEEGGAASAASAVLLSGTGTTPAPAPDAAEVSRVLSALQLREDESERLRVECRALAVAVAARDAHIRTLEEKIESLGGETGREEVDADE